MKELIAKIRNTKPYENLVEILGEDLGELLYQMVKESLKADKQLEILVETMDYIQNKEVNSANDPIDRLLSQAIGRCNNV